MKISTDRSSLQIDTDNPTGCASYVAASINLTIDGQTRRVPAFVCERWIEIKGIAVRIGGGQKVWQGAASLWNGRDGADLSNVDAIGRDRRRGEAYVVGFYSDFSGEAVSRSNQAGQAGA